MYILTRKVNKSVKNSTPINNKWAMLESRLKEGTQLLVRHIGWTELEDLEVGCDIFSFKRSRYEEFIQLEDESNVT